MKVFPRPADPDFVDYQLRWDWDRPNAYLGISSVFRHHTTLGKHFSSVFGEEEARFMLRSRFDKPTTVERVGTLRGFYWTFDGKDFASQILDLWIELDPEGWSDGYAVSENLPRRIL